MVNDNQGMDMIPLQAQYMTTRTTDPPHKRQQMCKINTIPFLDEYVMDNSEDEIDGIIIP